MLKSFVDIFFFCVSSACHYHWLLNLKIFNKFSYLFRSCIAIHNGHWTIHEDQPVRGSALFEWWNNKVKCLLTIVRAVDNWANIRISRLFQNNSESKNIVRLIVNYHYSPVFIHIINHFFIIYILCISWQVVCSLVFFILWQIKFKSARYH